jgi:hypothetical protein
MDSNRFNILSYPSTCLCLMVCKPPDEINVIVLPTSVDVYKSKCLHNDKYIRYYLRRGKFYKSFYIQTYELYSTLNTENISSFEMYEFFFTKGKFAKVSDSFLSLRNNMLNLNSACAQQLAKKSQKRDNTSVRFIQTKMSNKPGISVCPPSPPKPYGGKLGNVTWSSSS